MLDGVQFLGISDTTGCKLTASVDFQPSAARFVFLGA